MKLTITLLAAVGTCSGALATAPPLADGPRADAPRFDVPPRVDDGLPMVVPNELVIEFRKIGTDALRVARKKEMPLREASPETHNLLDLIAVESVRPQFPGAPIAPKNGGPDLSNYHVVRIDPAVAPGGLEGALALALAHPLVRNAELIGVHPVSATVNDPYFANCWHLNQSNDADVDAPEAWDVQTGDPSIIVAVLDTGVQWYHADLAGNAATAGNLHGRRQHVAKHRRGQRNRRGR
jgi:subtilisin family serine protease